MEYDDPPKQNPDYWQIFPLYENGKSRRYGHLFAVNAGAYALVGFLAGRYDGPGLAGLLFGLWAFLLIPMLMLVFSWVMCDDIDSFGRGMRQQAGYPRDTRLEEGIYRDEGRRLLRYVRWIFATGWSTAAALAIAAMLGLAGSGPLRPARRSAP